MAQIEEMARRESDASIQSSPLKYTQSQSHTPCTSSTQSYTGSHPSLVPITEPGTRQRQKGKQPLSPTSQLMVDIHSSTKKSRSLPGHGRRQKSEPILKGAGYSSIKRTKRKYDSEGNSGSLSDLCEPVYQTPRSSTPRTVTMRGENSNNPIGNGQLPIGMGTSRSIPENDDELIIRIENDLDSALQNSGQVPRRP